ncbi:MAG: hypothetical protein ACRD4Q_01030 [Candidatus Acidiferrales bacterium]
MEHPCRVEQPTLPGPFKQFSGCPTGLPDECGTDISSSDDAARIFEYLSEPLQQFRPVWHQIHECASASAVFPARIQQHLDRYGVSLRDLVWQTDNGGEFKGDFPKALGQSQHVRIPPSAHTYQSDVETVHRLEEDEFFDLEDFSSRGDFLAKVHTYQLYFNLARPNSHKEKSNPVANHRAPRSAFAP